MLKRPYLALVKNRNQLARRNGRSGEPDEWFSQEAFSLAGVYRTSFDFFVDWEAKAICNEVWVKRISTDDTVYQMNKKELRDAIVELDGREAARRLYYFCRENHLREKYMIFRDLPEESWENGEGRILELDISNYGSNCIHYYTVEEIQKKIQSLRKRPASIGNAGMIYATSCLEGYLSKQPYFWPGDADCILFDDNDNTLAIIEYKKHTERSKIPFEQQGIHNYIKKDQLKYESLGLLRNRLHTKLFVLYYPVQPNIDFVMLEKITGEYNALRAEYTEQIPIPVRRDAKRQQEFAQRILALVKEEEGE